MILISTWFSTSVSSMRVVRLLNARFTRFNTVCCELHSVASRGVIIATKLRLIDSRLQRARVATRKIAENLHPLGQLSQNITFSCPYQLMPLSLSGFSARYVTRRRDEFTRMKKLESRAAERNAFYEFSETWTNTSLTDISKAFVMLLKD